ncbi:MAG: DUF4411 family protein [Bacteroidetes bacterium]|nr:DUF4411 family protein [Bacteroidota bacterium]
MSVYVVDSNFFIQAHRASYPLDVATSFWSKVIQLAEDGKIVSIDKVKNEIFKNEDDLKQWCEINLPDNFFKDTSTIIPQYSQVATWAASKSGHYLPNALAEFLDADEADAWLIAYALVDPTQHILVTHELSEPNRKNKVKIPDVCIANGVQYCNTIEMLRQLGERF